MSTQQLRYLSLFSGVGGFELGIQRAFDNRRSTSSPALATGDSSVSTVSDGARRRSHATCVGYSEIDRYAIATYQKHFKEHKNYGDCTSIDETKLPDFDLLVGGFPCQAFSVAGKRHGFNDTRGTLFFDIARILSHKRPRHLVLENVKGLLSHDSGKTFQTILGVLTDLGYVVEWQVLNAKGFGVPQNRERIFIVGHLGGDCGRKVLPIIGTDTKTNTTQELLEPISNCLRTNYSNGKSNETYIRQLNQPKHSNDRVYAEDGISPTLNTMGGGLRQPFVAPVLTPDRLEKRQNGRRFKNDGEPSFTLNTQDKHGIYDGARIRRLTPLECERLMSWPDNWTIGSDTQRYKQCGNGVVSNVVQAVIERMEPCLAP